MSASWGDILNTAVKSAGDAYVANQTGRPANDNDREQQKQTLPFDSQWLWLGVIALGVIGVVLIVGRNLKG